MLDCVDKRIILYWFAPHYAEIPKWFVLYANIDDYYILCSTECYLLLYIEWITPALFVRLESRFVLYKH